MPAFDEPPADDDLGDDAPAVVHREREPWFQTFTPSNLNNFFRFGIVAIVAFVLLPAAQDVGSSIANIGPHLARLLVPDPAASVYLTTRPSQSIALINYTAPLISTTETSQDLVTRYLRLLGLENHVENLDMRTQELKHLVTLSEKSANELTRSVAKSDAVCADILAALQDEQRNEVDDDEKTWWTLFLTLFTPTRQQRVQARLSRLKHVAESSKAHRHNLALELLDLQTKFTTRFISPICQLRKTYAKKQEEICLNPSLATPISGSGSGNSAAEHELTPLGHIVDALEACCNFAKQGAKQLAVQIARVQRETEFLQNDGAKLKSELQKLKKMKGRAGKGQVRVAEGVLGTFAKDWDKHKSKYYSPAVDE